MTILAYHAVHPTWRSSLSVPPEMFVRQIAWLERHRTVVPLESAIEDLGPGGGLRRGRAVVTFDDGFECLHEHALPIVRAHRLPATVFLVAQTLAPEGRPVDWVDDPPPEGLKTLTLDQVLEMREAGVAFGSHSWAHRNLTLLSDEECERDLRQSRELLEDLLGEPVRFLAYPRGDQDERVRRLSERAGFSHGFAEDTRGPEAKGTFAVRRAGIYHGNSMTTFKTKSARWYLPFRSSRLFPLVRRLVRRGATTTPPG